jgi:hypothetical protein
VGRLAEVHPPAGPVEVAELAALLGPPRTLAGRRLLLVIARRVAVVALAVVLEPLGLWVLTVERTPPIDVGRRVAALVAGLLGDGDAGDEGVPIPETELAANGPHLGHHLLAGPHRALGA